MLCNMVARGHADTYQKHNVGNVGNVGYGFQVAKTPRTIHGHILTVIPYNYIYNFTDFNNLIAYIAYKPKKPLWPLVKTVGSLTLKHCPQSNPHRPHLLRVYPYKIILDNCKEIPYIVCVARYCPRSQLQESHMQVHLTMKSANVKTGPIPVSTTERASCPPNCAVRDACYAASGPLALHWAAVSNGTRGTDWGEFCDTVASMPAGQLWRHNQAGDLPVAGGTIDAVKLGQLVAANAGRRGFTYSHHRDAASIAWIRHANAWGFTVNLSANDLNDADYLASQNAGPVVVVLPSTTTQNTTTPAGRAVVICPATQRDDVSCATCQLCQRQRAAIVGFPAHGTKKRVIDIKLAA